MGGECPQGAEDSWVSTGWEAIDRAIAGMEAAKPEREAARPAEREGEAARGGLARGALHEWCGVEVDPEHERISRGDRWTAPLALLMHLASAALSPDGEDGARGAERGESGRNEEHGHGGHGGHEGHVVWIGRPVWPYAPALARSDPLLLERSLFVDPPDDAARLWAIDLALRCGAFAAVVADGSGVKMAHSRRLQLAAAAGNGLGLLARPSWERHELSAAATRWWVASRREPAGGREPAGTREPIVPGPRWVVTLMRCKGRQVLSDHGRAHLPRRWVMEKDRGQGAVRLLAELVDRSLPAPLPEERGRVAI